MTSASTRILVTGGNGRLASALRPFFPYGHFPSKAECNVADQRHVSEYAKRLGAPDLIIHAAAETRPDAPSASYRQNNIVGTVNIASLADRTGARLVYLSTDAVYPGIRKHQAEWEPVLPLSSYAQSKYAGEVIAMSNGNTLVIRGSWYSTLDYTHAATDAYTSAVPVDKAAGWIARLALSTATGIVNVGGTRRSRYEVMLEFNQKVHPCTRNDWRSLGFCHPIPADLSLDTTVMRRLLKQ